MVDDEDAHTIVQMEEKREPFAAADFQDKAKLGLRRSRASKKKERRDSRCL